ncbi:S-layer homology domain-containing protein [Sporosarcina sp. ACRSM]|uniref:S-layer homology domain-containing protein n=1 Tax=Sporosarcina sp. ACRSM TaxID=2918216 RepID=UPI001EF4A620|nr:S-layer homology domain-containing protein [Sporosarcina sp. ACRSM]MCG7336528.1 S-layer homology domain-containing protein [Sporosarcina sp. ACRSM]
MVNKQSARYKKFVLGAASAALVAAAVAPVVSAKEFNDVKADHTHKPAIDALSDAGVISGYQDGTFKPGKTLTRSDVVKLMGKWLVSEGYKIPADYKTKMRFTDLTATSNDELLQYAAVVKDNGVFNGNNGRLMAADNITRENMAVVLVRAFDKLHNMDLVAYVEAQDFDKDVIDRAKAKEEARPAIDVLDFFDITNPAAPAFNPKNTTTRGQFATFLHKTINTDFSAVKAPEVSEDKAAVEAAAKQVKDGEVTVSRGEYATDANKLAAVQTYVNGLMKEEGVTVKAAAGKTAGEYVVTLTKGEEKVEKTIAVTFKFAADDRFVTEVNALNATQVEVKFSTAVDANSVLGANGAIKANTISLTSLDKVDAGTLKGELSKDGKTLTITAKNILSKRYDVVVDGLKSVNGAAIDKYEATITIAADKTAPVILGTTNISASKVKVSFSEPMQAIPASSVQFTLADGTKVTGITGDLATGDQEVTYDLSAAEVGQAITATFIGAKDIAGNLITPNPAKVTFQKGAKDGVAPSVKEITQMGAKKFAIKFSEEIQTPAKNAIEVSVGSTSNAVASIEKDQLDATTYIVTVANDLDGLTTIKTADKKVVTDLSGETATFSKVVSFVKDTVAPKVLSTKVIVDKEKEYLEITFDKNVKLTEKDSKVTAKGSYVKDSVTHEVTGLSATELEHKDENSKKVVRVALATLLGNADEKGAAYQLDLAFTDVVSETGEAAADVKAITFTRGEDGTPATEEKIKVNGVQQSTNDNNEVVVTFDQEVDADTATVAANYKISGAEVESATVNAGALKKVTLTLKADSNTFTGERNVVIENVKAKGSSVAMNKYEGTVALNENVAPTVTKAVLTADNEITLTFSENVTVPENAFELFIGDSNTKVAGATVAEVTEGKEVVITLAGKKTTFTDADMNAGVVVKLANNKKVFDTVNNPLNFKSIKVTR